VIAEGTKQSTWAPGCVPLKTRLWLSKDRETDRLTLFNALISQLQKLRSAPDQSLHNAVVYVREREG